jgi:hypothetical protein
VIAARNDGTIRDVGQIVAIGDKHFEVVKEFVNLGSLMTPTNDVSLEVQRRIQTIYRCFFGFCQHLQSSHLSHQTKFTIYKTLICPVLLYGSETWVLTKREVNQLLVFERKVHRTIIGPKIENMVSTMPECPRCHEDRKQADCATLRWSHDQKTRKPTIKSSIQS